jgi:peptidoglycan/xylan/chitin deacetylase (PgdA/CDA1 family)
MRSITRIFGVILIILLLGFSLDIVIRPPQWVIRGIAKHNPHTLFYVDTDDKAIALTIDDSPHPDVTPGILEALRRHGASATFFIIGAHAEQYPEWVDSIRANGHELGNHLHTDRMSVRLRSEEFTQELKRTDALIRPEGQMKWCRTGSGVVSDRVTRLMGEEGYRSCLASVYPWDLRFPERLARWQFMTNVRPGAILVLHDGSPTRRKSISILDEVLPRLTARGYRVVSVSELVELAQ